MHIHMHTHTHTERQTDTQRERERERERKRERERERERERDTHTNTHTHKHTHKHTGMAETDTSTCIVTNVTVEESIHLIRSLAQVVYVRVRARIAHPLQIRDHALRCAGGQRPMAKCLSDGRPCCRCCCQYTNHLRSKNKLSQHTHGSPHVPVATSDICIMPIIMPISR